VMAWVGYQHASASGTTSVAKAEADIAETTAMGRARFYLQEKHSFIFDTGLGVTNYSMSASGEGILASNSSDSVKYELKGTPFVGNFGVGYGYRSNDWFRVSVTMGALFHFNRPDPGTVTSTGSFTEADRAELRTEMEEICDKQLFRTRAYLDASFGFLF
jgi:hypothetical protein